MNIVHFIITSTSQNICLLQTTINSLIRSFLEWTVCITDTIFKKIEIVKFITTALKGILNLVNCKVWLRNVVKCEKYKPAKFENFVYFCITREN